MEMAMVEVDDVANLEFNWGKKRGVGGKKKEVQFYESFTYDGVDYTLYDSVYMFKEGEPDPYIGKLIKIWESGDKTKKVKVQWFFQPSEIIGWLRDVRVLENEIFLATGEGIGLANVNPLEAIAGKCNVVCTSKDNRNRQPSEDELKWADYIFYRTFDVGLCTILDKMDDKVGGTEVRFVFNKEESEALCAVPECITDGKNEKMYSVACNSTQKETAPTAIGEIKSLMTNGNNNQSVAFNDVKDVRVKGEYLSDVKPASVTAVEINTLSTVIGQQASPLGDEVTGSKADAVKDELDMATDTKVSVKAEKRPQPDSEEKQEKPAKKAKKDDVIKSSVDKSRNNTQKLIGRGNDVKALATTTTDAGNTKFGNEVTIRQGKDKTSKHGNVDCPSKEKNINIIVKGPCDKEKLGNKTKGLSGGKLTKRPVPDYGCKERESDGKIFDVTARPDVDNSKWFKQTAFEERVKTAQKDGTILMLHNLDPEYVSGEVEDIIWHALKEHCSAKMVQRTKVSTTNSGQAVILFKSREGTERVMAKLNEGCLMLPNGRPLVCSTPPTFPGKQSKFYGHLVIDKAQREKKDAVSTSHCSQPNTIEYDMAMEWCLLQARSDSWWKGLYKQQGQELRRLKATFKSK